MSIRHLDRWLEPKSIALIGALDRAGSVGATAWRNLRAAGFAGPICAVNPRRSTLDRPRPKAAGRTRQARHLRPGGQNPAAEAIIKA